MPTFTTPPDFSSGEVLTAADLDVLGDDINYLYQQSTQVAFYGARMTNSGSLSLSTGPYTDVPWDGETFDVGTWWTSGAAITVPAVAIPSGFTTVVLLVTGAAHFAANGTGSRGIRILKDGAEWRTVSASAIASPDTTSLAVTDLVTAVSGTVIKLQVAQNSGGSLTADQLFFSVLRYAALS